MNPFDLPGPQFLAFYLLLMVVVNAGLALWLWWRELGSDREPPKLTDPYAIAYLRGGKDEAVRITTLSLVDRGLLKAKNESVVAHGWSAAALRHRLEVAVLNHFAYPRTALTVFESPDMGVRNACRTYEKELEDQGLLPNAAQRRERLIALATALTVLCGAAGIKICVALVRGRHNLFFLVLFAAAAGFIAYNVFCKTRTSRGNKLLADFCRVFKGLKARTAQMRAGSNTTEAVLLSAIWGISALPAIGFPFVSALFPKAAKAGNSSGSWTGGCGSGCASGGASGGCGGGGCGGGGCGGGCGGCGG